jgi:hypothetical protein
MESLKLLDGFEDLRNGKLSLCLTTLREGIPWLIYVAAILLLIPALDRLLIVEKSLGAIARKQGVLLFYCQRLWSCGLF